MSFSESTKSWNRVMRHLPAMVAKLKGKNVGSSQVARSLSDIYSQRKNVDPVKMKVMNKELVIGTLQCIFFALVCYFIILIFH
jgi:hypothetical protein